MSAPKPSFIPARFVRGNHHAAPVFRNLRPAGIDQTGRWLALDHGYLLFQLGGKPVIIRVQVGNPLAAADLGTEVSSCTWALVQLRPKNHFVAKGTDDSDA